MKPFWNKIDPDHLPEGEVLAACFDKESGYYLEKALGLLQKDEKHNRILLKDFYEYIFPVTHYHDIDQYDKENE